MNSSDSQNTSQGPSAMTLENTPTLYVALIGFPILLFISTVGNVTTLVILFRTPVKRPATIYFICGAMADLCVLWLGVAGYIVMIPSAEDSLPQDFWDNYALYRPFGESLWQNLSIQFSDWTLIVLSVERLMAVLRPLRYRHSKERAYSRKAVVVEIVVLLLAVIAIINNPIMQYFYTLNQDFAPPELEHWKTLQANAEVGLTLAKWLVLLIANLMLVVAVSRHRNDMVTHGIQTDTASQNRTAMRSLNAATLGLAILYITTQFPNVLFKSLEIASKPPYNTYNLSCDTKRQAAPVIGTMVLINYALGGTMVSIASASNRKKVGDHLTVLRTKFRKWRLSGLANWDDDAGMSYIQRKYHRRRSSLMPYHDSSASMETIETFDL